MAKLDCDTCTYYDMFAAPACNTCITNTDGNASNYVRAEDLAHPQDDHIEILNALATLIELCEKYQSIADGCATMCPLRCSEGEQLDGYGVCSLESPMPPLSWNIREPKDDDDFPILLETDFYVELEEDEDEITP